MEDTFAQLQKLTGYKAPEGPIPNVLTGELEHGGEDGHGRARLTKVEDVERFVLAGNATITVVSKKTGKRYTYRVSKPNDFDVSRPIWFVSVLKGSDNDRDFGYIGQIRHKRAAYYDYEQGKKCWRDWYAASDAFLWAWYAIAMSLPERLEQIEIWHEGRCGRCGRKLTVPESIASGFGPECVEMV